MRRLLAVFGVFVMFLLSFAAGCGEPASTASTEPSEIPDAVVTTDSEPTDATVDTTDSGEAKVVVEKAGFSHEAQYGELAYGIVLKNPSSMDATEVQVSINMLDKSGTILSTEDSMINVIPAGETYYFGGSTYIEGSKPKKMEAFVDVGSSESAQYALPEVSKVRIVRDDWGGFSVRGQVKNNLDGTLSSLATITCVVFDKNGKVVGGGFTYLDSDLPSGRTAGFEIVNGPGAIPPSKAAEAKASMDNEVAY